MDPTVVLVLGLLPVAVFVMWPLFSSSAGAEVRPEREDMAGSLERRKLAALSAIKEAEFDQRTGKLSDEDYDTLIARYKGQAMQAIADLETRATLSAKGQTAAAPAPQSAESRVRFCPSCGTPAPTGGKFCSACGKPLPARRQDR